MYQNLVVRAGLSSARESVHLENYPVPQRDSIDEALALEMAAVREVVSLGLSVRTANKLKVRQPLSRADVVFNDRDALARLQAHRELIAEELNVHEVMFMHPGHEQGAVSFKLKPDFRALGPRLGKRVQAVKKVLESVDAQAAHAQLSQNGALSVSVDGESMDLTSDEVVVSVSAAEGFAAETGDVGVVVLHTTLTEALIDEGLLRELVSRIQAARKEQKLDFTDRIVVHLDGGERILRVARAGASHIQKECLADAVRIGSKAERAKEFSLGGEVAQLGVEPN